MELAFDHLFDVALDDDEAQRIYVRFKRARSQVLPIFSSMVVSPYERERQVALTMLANIGGQATAKMLDGILADDEVHDAFKLDVRRLRDQLAPDLSPDDDEDDDLEDADEREDVETTTDDETEPVVANDEVVAAESPERPSRRRRRAGRGRSRKEKQPAEATIDPQVFEGDPQQLLPHLEGPLEPVLQAFADVPLPKRLSFVDRSSRLQDRGILKFLLPLLQTDEWALVQSALRAIGQLGFAEALPDVEALAADSSRKRVKLRAERVRDQLLAAGDQAAATAETPPETEPEPEPAEPPAPKQRSESGRGKPQPKRRGRGGEAAERQPEPTAGPADEFGLMEFPPPDVRPAPSPALHAPERLPRLGACLASGVGLDGLQRLMIIRQAEGDEAGYDRLEMLLHARLGWVDLAFTRGCGPQAVKDAQEQAAARGEALVEVTVGYVRGRLSEAADQTKGVGGELPAQAEAALQYVGSGRKQELAAAVPESAEAVGQDVVEQLLNHPLFAGWRLPLAPDGGAVQRWEQTTGKRSASRVRRRLIDDVTRGWHQTGVATTVVERLSQQAWLLQRAGQDDLAQAALACAATLASEQKHPERHLLLRELVYRGFQAGLDQAEARRERQARAAYLHARRNALSRSAFQRGLRRR